MKKTKHVKCICPVRHRIMRPTTNELHEITIPAKIIKKYPWLRDIDFAVVEINEIKIY